jgi:AraC family transcriptional activator of pobA
MENIPIRHISATVKEPEFSGSFNIRKVEDLLSGKKMVQELHRHSFFFVLVLPKAVGEHSIDFTPYPVGDGCVFFTRPGQVHQLSLASGTTGYMMAIEKEFYSPPARSAGKNYFLFEPDQVKKLMTLLNIVFQEYVEKQERHQEVIRSVLDVFFVQVLRQDSIGRNADYTQEKLDELLALIETEGVQNRQVAYYADKMHLSAWQLNAITKAAVGKTCSELVTDHVLLEAKRHLLATSGQINQIAGQLGFEDTSYFIRFFKKHTGSSPEAFRNKLK